MGCADVSLLAILVVMVNTCPSWHAICFRHSGLSERSSSRSKSGTRPHCFMTSSPRKADISARAAPARSSITAPLGNVTLSLTLSRLILEPAPKQKRVAMAVDQTVLRGSSRRRPPDVTRLHCAQLRSQDSSPGRHHSCISDPAHRRGYGLSFRGH